MNNVISLPIKQNMSITFIDDLDGVTPRAIPFYEVDEILYDGCIYSIANKDGLWYEVESCKWINGIYEY